jgi:tetratricopeptide (TPR) repeat protein
LHATRGRFVLRILDAKTRDPLLACNVYANQNGFSAISDADLLGAPDRNGYVVSNEQMDKLAFIKIVQGSNGGIQFPLVITSELFDYTVPLPRDQAAAMKSDFQSRWKSLGSDLTFLSSFNKIGVAEINKLAQDKRYEEALDRATHLAASLKQMIKDSRKLRDDLRRQAEALKLDPKKRTEDLDRLDQRLSSMDAYGEDMDEMAKSLSIVIKENSQKARAAAAAKLGKAAEDAGNFDQAIANYEQSLQEIANPKLLKKLSQLKDAWKIKSPAHKNAREFVFDIWAIQNISDLDTVAKTVAKAKAVIVTLTKVNDYLTADKFKNATAGFVDELADIVSQLQDAERPEDRSEIDRIKTTIEDLAELAKQADKIQHPESEQADSENTSPSDSADDTNKRDP